MWPMGLWFLYKKSMKIFQNTLKIEEKFSDVPKRFRVGPKNVGLVGFLETRHLVFFWSNVTWQNILCCVYGRINNPMKLKIILQKIVICSKQDLKKSSAYFGIVKLKGFLSD